MQKDPVSVWKSSVIGLKRCPQSWKLLKMSRNERKEGTLSHVGAQLGRR